MNIQRKTITIQTYLDNSECKYTEDSFYGALERLAKNKSIKDVYLASAASSTDNRSLVQTTGQEKWYRSRHIVHEFGMQGRYFVGNRYLQDFCQLLSLMKNIADAGKSVSFITLDTRLPAFKHSSVALKEPNPASKNFLHSEETYAVPFDKTTEFFVNDMFEEYIPKPPPKNAQGGRRKSRKQKRRTTRKRRV